MAFAKKDDSEKKIVIKPIEFGMINLHLVGVTPFIFNAVSEKGRQQLLAGGRKKNNAEKAISFKHEPLEEFQNCVYRFEEPSSAMPLLCFKGGGPKAAMVNATKDIPGATGAAIKRLVTIPAYMIPMWGVPEMMMSIMKSSDINKTPDVRTRAILREWCTVVSVRYIMPNLDQETVINLLAAAGMLAGLGDSRSEKGYESFGQFRVVNADDKDFLRIQKNGGQKVQIAALQEPGFFDHDTQRLYTWFMGEKERRRSSPATSKKTTVVGDHEGVAPQLGKKKGRPAKTNGVHPEVRA